SILRIVYCIVLTTLKCKTEFRHRSTQAALQFASLSHTPSDKQSLCVEPATTEQPSLAINLQLLPKGLRVAAAPGDGIEYPLAGKRFKPTFQRLVGFSQLWRHVDLLLFDFGQLGDRGTQFLVGGHF